MVPGRSGQSVLVFPFLVLLWVCSLPMSAFSQKARIVIWPEPTLGEISPYIYSSVIRWDLRRGLALPENATPEDFYLLAKWVKDLKLSMLRYPGGLVADAFHWKESIGPLERRPLGSITGFDRDRHSRIVVGVDEFLHFCELVGAEPLMVVNFGSGSPQEGADLVEYLNAPNDGSNPGGGVDWAKQRATNGHPRAYGVKYFEIGNEIFHSQGRKRSYQPLGHTDAKSYATKLVEFAGAMRKIDPSIRIGAGVTRPGQITSSDRSAGTNRPWNKTLFEIAGSEIDFVCPHRYGPGGGRRGYQPTVEAFVKRSFAYLQDLRGGLGELREEMRQNAGRESEVWVTEYNMAPSTLDLLSGLYVASFLCFCIDSDIQAAMFHNLFGFGGGFPALKFLKDENRRIPRPTYFAIKLLSHRLRGRRLKVVVNCPTFVSEYYPKLEVPYLTAVAARRGQTLVLAVVNRDIRRDCPTEIEIVGQRTPSSVRLFELGAPDFKTSNENDLDPRRTTVKLREDTLTTGGEELTYSFPAHSVTILEF